MTTWHNLLVEVAENNTTKSLCYEYEKRRTVFDLISLCHKRNLKIQTNQSHALSNENLEEVKR